MYRRLKDNVYYKRSTFDDKVFKILFYRKEREGTYITSTPPYDVYDKSTFLEGNYLSPVVCGLIWMWDRDRMPPEWVNLAESLHPHCAIVSPIRTVLGLKYVFRNLVLNPNIRTVIMTGPCMKICANGHIFDKNSLNASKCPICGEKLREDVDNGHMVGTALLDIWRHGLNRFGEIAQQSRPISQPKVPDVPQRVVDTIRRNVILVDLRGAEFETVKAAAKFSHNWPDDVYQLTYSGEKYFLSDQGAWGDPVYVRFPEVMVRFKRGTAQDFLSAGEALIFETIDDAWLGTIDYVTRHGTWTLDQRKMLTLECLFIKEIIQRPWVEPKLFDKRLLEKYVEDQLEVADSSAFEYKYGERLLAYNRRVDARPLNQLKMIAERLKEDPNTRRAYASLWDSRVDFKLNDPPCFTNLQFFIRENELILKAEFRSHHLATVDSSLKVDANSGAFIPNLYLISKLHEILRDMLKNDFPSLKLGPLVLIAGSEHLYVKPS